MATKVDKAEAKRQFIADQKLENEFSVMFKKKELILLNNVLLGKEFRVLDALAIVPILDKIRPFIVDTMQQSKAPTNNVITSTKEETKETN